MKKILISLFILSVASTNAQDLKLSLGYKSIEVGATKTLESELIFGGAVSITDTHQIEKRANQFSQIHKIYDKAIPTTFALLGAKFNRFSMIGKVGACYINRQDVTENNVTEPYNHKFFLAVGMQLMYMVSDRIGVSGSFDNVNSAMVGINYKIY